MSDITYFAFTGKIYQQLGKNQYFVKTACNGKNFTLFPILPLHLVNSKKIYQLLNLAVTNDFN
jgi:hypothetical protein